MNTRINKLRKLSLEAENTISTERALLITEFYKNNEDKNYSIPVMRAKAFEYFLLNKALYLHPEELIVGERGPQPKATPTYPEICLHSLDDLRILNDRPKVSFTVDEKAFMEYEKIIIPYWKGKSLREKIFEQLPMQWKSCYNAGIFTEFLEQRAPGHTVAGNNIYHKGMLDFIQDIRQSRKQLEIKGIAPNDTRFDALQAMEIAANALIAYANRYADALLSMAEKENNPQDNENLKKIAAICRKVPAHAPETFHEALQHYWFIHIGVISELNPWDSFNPGRLDQHLLPFYRNALETNQCTIEELKEMLQAFWIKFNNHPAPPKVGVTALESNTYTDFALINVGGLTADGDDGVNEVSYLILDVIEEMRLLQPSSMAQVSKKNPDAFIKRVAEVTKTGFGQPSYFNSDAIIQQLLRQGKSIEDARNGGASGCVETGAFGKEAYILTGYFSFVKVLEITLNNGIDPLTRQQLGLNNNMAFTSFDALLKSFVEQLNYFIDIKLQGNNIIEQIYAQIMPAPFLSLIIEDCIANAKDYNNGGARYNTRYIQGVGIGTITDSLSAMKYHIFDNETISFNSFMQAMHQNYSDYDELRHLLIFDTPKWGNDNEYADHLAKFVFKAFFNSVEGKTSPGGANYRINLLPTTSHVYFGSKIGATPDGRKAFEPISEGISPVQGADRLGPTAVIKSVAKLDHIKTGGTLLNQKFHPTFFSSDASINKFVQLIRTYFKLDGHHIQFNVVDAQTLRDAQKNPEKFLDLIVRVAGYSDYFNHLSEDLQNEIIRRTEHSAI